MDRPRAESARSRLPFGTACCDALLKLFDLRSLRTVTVTAASTFSIGGTIDCFVISGFFARTTSDLSFGLSGSLEDAASQSWFYVDRAARSHCDHRSADRVAPAGGAKCPRGRPADSVQEQPQADRSSASQLPRHTQHLPAGGRQSRLRSLDDLGL